MKNTEGLPCGRGLAAPESLSFVVSFFYHSLDFVCKHSNCYWERAKQNTRLALGWFPHQSGVSYEEVYIDFLLSDAGVNLRLCRFHLCFHPHGWC